MKKIVLVFFVSIFLIQCSTVPISGRKRVSPVKDEVVLPASFAEYKSFLSKNKISKDVVNTKRIKKIGQKLSKVVDKYMRKNGMTKEANAYRWEFNLVDNKTVNAWCMPGGKVVFYTGILPICKNDDGIAAVMGHEIAHAFAKHGQERMKQKQLAAIGGVAVIAGTHKKKSSTRKLIAAAYGISSGVALLSYSRAHETEADKLGLVFMLMAGYNGEEAAQVWVRMKTSSKENKTPKFLRTHPSHDKRIEELRKFLPEAKKLAAQYNAQ